MADLFQWLHETRRTGVARFRTALGTATVWFRDGELVDADMGRFHQDAAVLRLMRIQDGEYEVEPKAVGQRRMIKQSTALLLAEGRQRAPRPGPTRGASGAEAASAVRPAMPSAGGRSASNASVSGSGSGEYSLVRDESRPRRPGDSEAQVTAGSGASEPRRGARSIDTGAHTLLNAKPPPRPAARAPAAPGTDAHTVVGRRSPVAPAPEAAPPARPPAPAEMESPARGPAARRRGLGWSPTAGGPGQAPEPTPSARSASSVPGRPVTDAPRAAVPPAAVPPAEPVEDPSTRSGRTRFMFGVSGPGAEREPSTPPVVRSEPPRAEPIAAPSSSRRAESFARVEPPRAEPIAAPSSSRRAESFARVEPPRAEPIAAPATPASPRFAATTPAPSPGAVTTPVPPEDSARTSTESRRRRARAVARAQAPFEPERTDRTLLRPGPLPPPPGQPVIVPTSGSQAIPIGVPVTPSSSIPGVGASSSGAAIPVGVPVTPSSSIPGVGASSSGAAIPVGSAGRPVGSAPTSSTSLPVAPAPKPYKSPASMTTAIMGSDVAPPRPAPAAMPFGAPAPVLIDEEYSHPISVPSVPPISAGPGGTWMLGQPGGVAPRGSVDRPLPDDPDAEQTISMRAPDVLLAREPSVSSHVKAAGTAHVGRYEVLLRLARGGMGTVYLCRVTGEGGFRRLFALKVIRDHLNTNQAYVQMLLEEARIASRLSHPNIVSIIDIDTFAGQHYLVMDYVEGCTFSELLKAHPKARPPELVVPIVLDALTGLHAAHSMRGDDGSPHPVVHCDFSPQNMLVGVNGTCRLTDFGVSKAADALPNGPGRGKPGYLSPEQVRGLPLDTRSDIFSAGVVLWNALTGEQLFDGDDPQAVLHQVVTRKIPKPSTVGLRPPACFDRICLRALERDPDRRYQTAEQMLMDLRKVAIAEDLLAPSSAVGHWVQETFGAQIELRRQAAGLQPNPVVAALALRDFASGGAAGASAVAGPSGHSEGHGDSSVTGHDPDASMTMMLRGGIPREELEEDREGLGARTRVVVIVAALAFIAAGFVTLLVRPDLLQGGIVDERGQYIDLTVPADQEPLTGTGGEQPKPGDDTTGAPAVVAGDNRSADTEGDTDTDAAGELEGDTETAVGTDDEDKPRGRARTKPDDGKAPADDTKVDPGKGGKGGKGKGKPDPGSDAPPPDLDELFRPPGG